MFKKLTKKSSKNEPAQATSLEVMLIGCGPGGMALLHALAYQKSKNPNLVLPNITCYERASSAGGLWRTAEDRTKPENKATMYDDLWCNVPKELMEYFDYTFNEHFKGSKSTFLQRKDVLDYIIARNSLDGALDNVKFNHTVKSVKYDDASSKFKAVIVKPDGTTLNEEYDRCIWAGGVNGFLEDPEDVEEVLKEYTGKVLHSSEAYEDLDVKGKTVLMIGDGSSAEDLALRFLKMGVKKVYICARSGQGAASDTTSWPKDKVEMIWGVPYKVVKGTGFKCQGVYWSEKRQKYRKDDEDPPIKVKDIDTVFMCTGYNANLTMLDKSLRFNEDVEWKVPKGWEMENNAFTISVGNVAASKSLMTGATVYPDIYKGLLISNPKMMYLMESDDSEYSLMEVDVNAWMILGHLTNAIETPKDKDMIKSNEKQLLQEMQIPWLRSGIDRNYLVELQELDDTNHWSENDDDERCIKLERQVKEFKVKTLGKNMKMCDYPVELCTGSKGDKLTDKGDKLVNLMLAAGKARSAVKKGEEGSQWWTYRDVLDPTKFCSIFDDTPSVPLSSHWMDI